MNILGVGGAELIIILVLMLIVAGPKRMIHWSYILGQYVAKFRRMWAETVDVLQREFDDAGVGVQIPRDLPTRGNINQQAAKMLGSVADPLKDTVNQVQTEMDQIRKSTDTAAKTASAAVRTTNGHTAVRTSKPAASGKPAAGVSGFGTWSSHEAKPDFGSWTANGQQSGENEE
jgi:Sec-independent protein translocase protein TatA